jgi:phosphoribosylcarboxyaminoimidazole (NCAIR) mutase
MTRLYGKTPQPVIARRLPTRQSLFSFWEMPPNLPLTSFTGNVFLFSALSKKGKNDKFGD